MASESRGRGFQAVIVALYAQKRALYVKIIVIYSIPTGTDRRKQLMQSSSLVSLITADALRAAIRALGILRDLRTSGLSLPRELRRQNSVTSLHHELCRLRGLGDLLVPISTTQENNLREKRLNVLLAILPQEPALPRLGERLVDDDLFAPERRANPEPNTHLNPKLRGELVAADEMAMRSLEEKVARQLGATFHSPSPDPRTSAQLNRALELLNEESASWRVLEGSRLANRLIADHGFADSYGQARKRARTLMKDQANDSRAGLKVRDVKALMRWHESVETQLGVLASGQNISSELRQLQEHLSALRLVQCRWLGLARLRRVASMAELGDGYMRGALVRAQEPHSEELLVLLQQCYGPSKSNFRGLIESELA